MSSEASTPDIPIPIVDRIFRRGTVKSWLAKHRPLLKSEHDKETTGLGNSMDKLGC
jgi:hypothetical protein